MTRKSKPYMQISSHLPSRNRQASPPFNRSQISTHRNFTGGKKARNRGNFALERNLGHVYGNRKFITPNHKCPRDPTYKSVSTERHSKEHRSYEHRTRQESIQLAFQKGSLHDKYARCVRNLLVNGMIIMHDLQNLIKELEAIQPDPAEMDWETTNTTYFLLNPKLENREPKMLEILSEGSGSLNRVGMER
ncbi:MAG: hypothetical protein M1834_002709 [Cirrosporium novae-zelandiae]|nr:MAG: hypothetical protein M1834_002709 [Cirrosporium novae-zelandiae]